MDLGETPVSWAEGFSESRALGMNVCADGKCGQWPENPDCEKNRGAEAREDFLCLIRFASRELSSSFTDEIHRLGGRSVKKSWWRGYEDLGK